MKILDPEPEPDPDLDWDPELDPYLDWYRYLVRIQPKKLGPVPEAINPFPKHQIKVVYNVLIGAKIRCQIEFGIWPHPTRPPNSSGSGSRTHHVYVYTVYRWSCTEYYCTGGGDI
jgi:hypothetical protein